MVSSASAQIEASKLALIFCIRYLTRDSWRRSSDDHRWWRENTELCNRSGHFHWSYCRIYSIHDNNWTRVRDNFNAQTLFWQLGRNHGSQFEKHKTAFEEGGGEDDAYIGEVEEEIGIKRGGGTPESASVEEKVRRESNAENVWFTWLIWLRYLFELKV